MSGFGHKGRIALTEDQFEELRRYEDGKPLWREERPNSNLVRRNLLMRVYGGGPGFYRITSYGQAMLKEFREVYGTP